MSLIYYTAKTSLAVGHLAESTYIIDLAIRSATSSIEDVKDSERAAGGAIETILHRQDRTWQIVFAPVRGSALELLREFLDSTEAGQLFRIYLYDDEATPLALRRLEAGHSEESFMRVGSRDGDWFQATINAVESRVFAADGFTVVEDSSESTDIYAPEVDGGSGDGGLDTPAPAFSGLLAVGHDDSPYVTIYDGATLAKLPDPAVLPPGTVNDAVFSPDGSLLAVAHFDSPYITIYNTADWSKVANPANLPAGPAFGLTFSPDGSLLAVAHENSPRVTIYQTSTWAKVANPSQLPAGDGEEVTFSPDGSLLAVAHWDSPYVTVYNTADWSKLTNPSVLPTANARGVAFSPDGSLLVVTHQGAPSYFTIYETTGWTTVAGPSTRPPSTAFDAAFSPDGSLLVIAHANTPGITIYNTADWSKVSDPVSTLTGGGAVSFSSDGSLLAVSTEASPYVVVYNVSDWSKRADPADLPPSNAYSAAFQP